MDKIIDIIDKQITCLFTCAPMFKLIELIILSIWTIMIFCFIINTHYSIKENKMTCLYPFITYCYVKIPFRRRGFIN